MEIQQRILASPAFREFLEQVQKKLMERLPDASTLEVSLQAERSELERQCQGWKVSLSNPSLSATVRYALEADMDQAMERITAIEIRVAEFQSSASRSQAAVDAVAVAERLEGLSEILAAENASATNLVLAQHIAGIYCDSEGKVVVRLCQLGALGNPELLGVVGSAGQQDGAESEPVTRASGRRRRTRRNVDPDFHDDEEVIDAANDFAVDPARFAGLGPEWFTDDVFHVPPRLSWAEEHASNVAEFRLKTNATMEKTAKHFGKSVPTIRQALRHAQEQHSINAFGKGVSAPTRAYWPRDNADAVVKFFSHPEATMKSAQDHFGKSQPWISKAKKIAHERTSTAPVDGPIPPVVTVEEREDESAA